MPGKVYQSDNTLGKVTPSHQLNKIMMLYGNVTIPLSIKYVVARLYSQIFMVIYLYEHKVIFGIMYLFSADFKNEYGRQTYNDLQ